MSECTISGKVLSELGPVRNHREMQGWTGRIGSWDELSWIPHFIMLGHDWSWAWFCSVFSRWNLQSSSIPSMNLESKARIAHSTCHLRTFTWWCWGLKLETCAWKTYCLQQTYIPSLIMNSTVAKSFSCILCKESYMLLIHPVINQRCLKIWLFLSSLELTAKSDGWLCGRNTSIAGGRGERMNIMLHYSYSSAIGLTGFSFSIEFVCVWKI